MALSEIQQATSIINQASSLLLIVPEKASADALASMIALYLTLQSSNERPREFHLLDEVSPSHLPSSLQFLAGSSQIKTEPTGQTEVVLDMIGPQAIDNIHYEQLQGGMRLHVSLPSPTDISKDQIETSIRLLPYDTVVVIGATDLEVLGPTFTKHADFFYNTPLLNIDHRAANEHFGTVNLVDITAGSCAEVTHNLITSLTKSTIEPSVATALYAGIVAGTDSFQKPSTTPRSFQVAAHLIEHEANRETVIQHLIKTKPLKLIKLAGSVYAHLRYEEHARLYWTILEKNNFLDSNATANDIPSVMHELANNIAGFNAAFLLYENPSSPTTHQNQDNQYHAYLLLGPGLKQRRREIQEILSATKQNGALTFNIAAPSIEAAEKQAHDKIRQILP